MMWIFPAIHSVIMGKTSARKVTIVAGAVLAVALFGRFDWPLPRVAGIRSPTVVGPGQSLAAAVSAARPGTTIVVRPGVYREKLVTARHGTARSPITIKANPGAVLAGEGSGRLMEVKHNYWRVEGFEMKEADVLLWLQHASHTVIKNNYFHHAQGECVRVKYHSRHNIFEGNRVTNCGLQDFAGGGSGKNGEGIYLGTAPEQLDKNPTAEIDQTSSNIIRRNSFNTQGNECVDIKEGSSANVVEFNDCTGQKDSASAGFDARGSGNIFRSNKSYGNAGAGIRLGGDGPADGINNQAYGNQLMNNKGVPLKVQRLPQGKICGNTITDRNRAISNNRRISNPPCLSP